MQDPCTVFDKVLPSLFLEAGRVLEMSQLLHSTISMQEHGKDLCELQLQWTKGRVHTAQVGFGIHYPHTESLSFHKSLVELLVPDGIFRCSSYDQWPVTRRHGVARMK